MGGKLQICGLAVCAWLCFHPMVAEGQGEDEAAAPHDAAPLTALEMVEFGRQAFEKGDFATAKGHFQGFMEAFGEEAEAQEALAAVRPLLALCYVRLREFDVAGELILASLNDSRTEPSLRGELIFWRGVCAMQKGEHEAARTAFETYYQAADPSEPRRVEAAVLYGNGFLLEGRDDEAVEFFEAMERQFAAADGYSVDTVSRFVMLHLHALLQLGDLDRAVALVRREADRFESFVQVVGLQSLVLDLGSRLLGEGRYLDAVGCFQQVWSRQRILTLQSQRMEHLSRRLRTARARDDADELVFQLQNLARRIERELKQFESVSDFDAGVRMRLARAYVGLQRHREAALVMEDLIRSEGSTSLVESAFISVIQCWMEVERWSKAVEAAEGYAKRFGWEEETAPSASTVLFLKGRALQRARREDDAITAFDALIERFPESPMAPNAYFVRGICHMQRDRYPRAAAVFESLPVKYPQAKDLAESALY